MSRQVKSRIALLPIAAAILAALGCTQQSGKAIPHTYAPASSDMDSGPSSSNSAEPLANFDTCVFNPTERKKYGLEKVPPPPSLPDASCSWRAGGAHITIGIIDKPVDQIVDPDEPPEPILINGSKAVQWTTGGGMGCWVSFGYGHQTLHVLALDTSSDKDCEIAKEFAKIVEPKLPPRGN